MNVLKSAQLNKYCDITALYFDIGDQPGFVVSLNDIHAITWKFRMVIHTNNKQSYCIFNVLTGQFRSWDTMCIMDHDND